MSIVCGYVPTEVGQRALEQAILETGFRGGPLVVVNSTRADRTVDVNYAHEPALAALEKTLEESGVPYQVRSFTSQNLASDDIVLAAEELEAELIVIGLRKRTPMGKALMGSDTQRILLQSPCPVLAVRA